MKHFLQLNIQNIQYATKSPGVITLSVLFLTLELVLVNT